MGSDRLCIQVGLNEAQALSESNSYVLLVLRFITDGQWAFYRLKVVKSLYKTSYSDHQSKNEYSVLCNRIGVIVKVQWPEWIPHFLNFIIYNSPTAHTWISWLGHGHWPLKSHYDSRRISVWDWSVLICYTPLYHLSSRLLRKIYLVKYTSFHNKNFSNSSKKWIQF